MMQLAFPYGFAEVLDLLLLATGKLPYVNRQKGDSIRISEAQPWSSLLSRFAFDSHTRPGRLPYHGWRLGNKAVPYNYPKRSLS